MSVLTSLLVRDQIVPVKKIEEAIQRQVISGGELDTILLHLKAVPENVLASYLGAVHGLGSSRVDEVMSVDRETIRTVPAEVATQHRLIPVKREGDVLWVARAAPLPHEIASQLGFLLGVELQVQVVCEVRVGAALHQHYGVSMVPRLSRLLAKLEGREEGDILVVTPLSASDGSLQPKAVESPNTLAIDEDTRAALEGSEFPATGVSTKKFGVVQEPRVPDSDSPELTVSPIVAEAESISSPSEIPTAGSPSTVEVSKVIGVRAAADIPAPVELPRIAKPRSELLRKHRGPLTASRAVSMLSDTTTRNEILEITFAFAKQFFDYTALFVVQEGCAEGLDAEGPGVDFDAVQRLSFSLDEPGTLSSVYQGIVASVSKMQASDQDKELASKLRRGHAQPSVVIPINIRSRVVLIMYGDRGGDDFGIVDIPELIGLVPRISDAFQQLIIRKKLRRRSESEDRLESQSDSPTATPSKGTWRPPAAPPSEESVAVVPVTGEEARLAAMQKLFVPRGAPPPPTVEEAGGQSNTDSGATALLEALEAEDAERESKQTVDTTYRVTGRTDVVSTRPSRSPPKRRSSVPPQKRSSAPPRKRHEWKPAEREPDASPPPEVEPVESVESDPQKAGQRTPSGPSVIVTMGENVEALVRELCTCGPDDEAGAVAALVRAGEASLPVLAREFPGPLWFDRRQPHRRLPRGRDVSAIARAFFAFGPRCAPYVASLLDHRNPDIRFYGTLVSTEFAVADLVPALGRRVFDSDDGTRILSLDALRLFSRHKDELSELVQTIRAAARAPRKDVEDRCNAVHALGELRDTGAIDLLIGIVSGDVSVASDPKANQSLVEEAHASLVLLTRQDFGSNGKKWRDWESRNQSKNRIEWLIDGLSHNEESMRAAASDELKQLTQEYYGYHPALPRRDRELVQRKYREWWKREGEERFHNH